MTATTTAIPTSIQPEALAFAEQHGLGAVMSQIIEQMKTMAPNLRSIVVTLETCPWDSTAAPQISIEGAEPLSTRPVADGELVRRLDRWMIDSFSPEVGSCFILDISPKGEE